MMRLGFKIGSNFVPGCDSYIEGLYGGFARLRSDEVGALCSSQGLVGIQLICVVRL